MGLTNAFRDYLASLATGTGTAFNNANAYLGVGDSTSAFAATQTDLQASSNKLRKGMDSGYPQVSGNVITLRATFATGEANFTWNEGATFNASSGGTMMQRDLPTAFTKTSALAIQVTKTITLNVS